MSGRPPKFETAEDMQEAIDSYFAQCKLDEEPTTINGLALALGMCRDSLHKYSKDGEFSDIVKKARQRVASNVERLMLSGKGSAAGTIFWLKNNDEWKDESKQVLAGDPDNPVEIVSRPQISREEWLKIHGGN